MRVNVMKASAYVSDVSFDIAAEGTEATWFEVKYKALPMHDSVHALKLPRSNSINQSINAKILRAHFSFDRIDSAVGTLVNLLKETSRYLGVKHKARQ
jgi:hypothetical protein